MFDSDSYHIKLCLKFDIKKVKNKRFASFFANMLRNMFFEESSSGGEKGTLYTSRFIPFLTTPLLLHNKVCFRA